MCTSGRSASTISRSPLGADARPGWAQAPGSSGAGRSPQSSSQVYGVERPGIVMLHRRSVPRGVGAWGVAGRRGVAGSAGSGGAAAGRAADLDICAPMRDLVGEPGAASGEATARSSERGPRRRAAIRRTGPTLAGSGSGQCRTSATGRQRDRRAGGRKVSPRRPMAGSRRVRSSLGDFCPGWPRGTAGGDATPRRAGHRAYASVATSASMILRSSGSAIRSS